MPVLTGGRAVVRGVAIALIAIVAGVLGLVGGLSWRIAVPAAFFIAAGALLIDILWFDRLASATDRVRRRVLVVLGAITSVAALALSFFGGVWYEQSSDPRVYPFRATDIVPVKALPIEGTQTNQVFDPGDLVWVECYATYEGRVWYKLSEYEGWLRNDELTPEPFTDIGEPPQCPS